VTHSIHLIDQPDEQLRQAIRVPLVEFNEAQATPAGDAPLAVALRDGDSTVVGGLWGDTRDGWLVIHHLAIPARLRLQGLGTSLMQLAESAAIARGCHGAWVGTFDYQARGFYERLGYEVFGHLPNYPAGHTLFFMRKDLLASA